MRRCKDTKPGGYRGTRVGAQGQEDAMAGGHKGGRA